MKSGTNSFRSQGGFTLIELLIVTVIIGTVASLAAPTFERVYQRHSLQTGNKQVVSTLKRARSTAVSTKQAHGVFFDLEAKTVTLFKNGNNPNAATFEAGDSVLMVDTLPDEFGYVYTDLPGNALVFQANGSAQLVGYGNIYLAAETEGMMASFATNVLASTGRVKSYSHYYAW